MVTFCSGHRVFTSSGENELPPGPQQTRTGKASLFCTNPRHGLEVPAMARNGGGGGRSRCREVSPGRRRERRKAGPDLEQMWGSAGGHLSAALSALLLCLPHFAASAPSGPGEACSIFSSHFTFLSGRCFSQLKKALTPSLLSPPDLGGGERLLLGAERASSGGLRGRLWWPLDSLRLLRGTGCQETPGH